MKKIMAKLKVKTMLRLVNGVSAFINLSLYCFFVKNLEFNAFLANVLVWVLTIGLMYAFIAKVVFPIEYSNSKERIKGILKFYFHRLLWLLIEEGGLIFFFSARGMVKFFLRYILRLTDVSMKGILLIIVLVIYDRFYGKIYKKLTFIGKYIRNLIRY